MSSENGAVAQITIEALQARKAQVLAERDQFIIEANQRITGYNSIAAEIDQWIAKLTPKTEPVTEAKTQTGDLFA